MAFAMHQVPGPKFILTDEQTGIFRALMRELA